MTEKKIIALLTDFGLSGHFTGVMKGVILNIDPALRIFDISHDIHPQNILEAAYTLSDTLIYWPAQTVFVAVVDPGVGTERRSITVRTNTNHIIVCPDNGLLTKITEYPGLKEARMIPERENRLPGSESYYTFHGRDVYAYNAARLASGIVKFEEFGIQIHPEEIELLKLGNARIEDGKISGNLIKIERPFGNVCTNISSELINSADIKYGDKIVYQLFESDNKRLEGELSLVKTFGEVAPYTAMAYVDSSGRLGLSVNQGDFSDYFQVQAGLTWQIILWKK